MVWDLAMRTRKGCNWGNCRSTPLTQGHSFSRVGRDWCGRPECAIQAVAVLGG